MGRGVSSGGGQSSLGYLFGSGEPPKSASATSTEAPQSAKVSADNNVVPVPRSDNVVSSPAAPPADVTKQIPAGIQTAGSNYVRADGQNSGNFIRDRTSTKIQSAPGGGSSLGYLFGSDGGSK